MNRQPAHLVPLVPETETVWRPGDLVVDAHGNLWSRASATDTSQGWPWGYPGEHIGVPGDFAVAEGSVDEATPVRPLTLLVREGVPVNTIIVAPPDTDDRQ
ncbi:hypothetical protein [Nocardia sp. NPDC004722]